MSESATRPIERLIASLTLGALLEAVRSLSKQESDLEQGVSLHVLMEHLTGDLDLGTGREGWANQLRLKRAIVSLVGGAPELRYIEGDA